MATLSRTTYLTIALQFPKGVIGLVGAGWFTVGAVSSAEAANLVKNGGFETGNLLEWNPAVVDDPTTLRDDNNANLLGATRQSDYVQSGEYGAFLGPVASPGFISQALPTKTGRQYQLSYFLGNVKFPGGTTDVPNVFQALVNGVPLFNETNLLPQPLTRYTFTFTAAAPSTELRFAFQNDPNFFALDDVSVEEIPSPALVPGLIALGLKLLRKRHESAVEQKDTIENPEDKIHEG